MLFRSIEELDLEDAEKQSVLERVEQGLYTISEVGREHLPQRVELNILPQLYSEFAEPYGLLEIVLLIFHVSDHRDAVLVQATWEAILERSESFFPVKW